MNYTDWANTTFSQGGRNVPDSCCRDDTQGCGTNILVNPSMEDVEKRIYTVGCVTELGEQVEHKAGVFAGIGVGIAFIQVRRPWYHPVRPRSNYRFLFLSQLIGMIFACLLARAISSSYHAV